MKYPDGRLILFARTPVPGQVKTRLAAGMGQEAAYALYCRMIEYMVEMTTRSGLSEVVLAAWPETDADRLQRLQQDYPIALISQQGKDLGERMFSALASQRKDAGFTILIGVDCVTLTSERLEQAAGLLQQGVAWVFNPARDGGYVLVGTSKPDAAVFEDIHWGGPDVMEQTRGRCRALGVAWQELPDLYDIDTHDDWLRLQRDFPQLYRQLTREVPTDERTAIR